MARYGADTVRLFLMFMGPWDQGGPVEPDRHRRREQVPRTASGRSCWTRTAATPATRRAAPCRAGETEADARDRMRAAAHRTLRDVTADYDGFRWNTMIAKLMELSNLLFRYRGTSVAGLPEWDEAVRLLLLMLAPAAPHITEEIWSRLAAARGEAWESIHVQRWPDVDESAVVEATREVPIQVNGKLRDKVTVPAGISETSWRQVILSRDKVPGRARRQEAAPDHPRGRRQARQHRRPAGMSGAGGGSRPGRLSAPDGARPEDPHDLPARRHPLRDDALPRLRPERPAPAGHVARAVAQLRRRDAGDRAARDRARGLRRGITHFDLANNYGPPYGSAEVNFGRILREDLAAHRDELVISSKAGWDMWPGPYGQGGGSRKHVLASLDQSLRRVGVDYFDIFYSHRFDLDTPLEETAGALATAVRAGQGAVHRDLVLLGRQDPRDGGAPAREGVPLLIHQPSYNLFNRWPEGGLLDALEAVGSGMIAFTALAQGLLSDKYLDGIPANSRINRPGGDSFPREMLNAENLGRVRGAQRDREAPRPVAGPDGVRVGPARPAGHEHAGRRELGRPDPRERGARWRTWRSRRRSWRRSTSYAVEGGVNLWEAPSTDWRPSSRDVVAAAGRCRVLGPGRRLLDTVSRDRGRGVRHPRRPAAAASGPASRRSAPSSGRADQRHRRPRHRAPDPTPAGPADEVRVTLGIYSGRPDPTWTLSAWDAAAVERAIEALPEAGGTPPEGGLGYHGFTVRPWGGRSRRTSGSYRRTAPDPSPRDGPGPHRRATSARARPDEARADRDRRGGAEPLSALTGGADAWRGWSPRRRWNRRGRMIHIRGEPWPTRSTPA